MLLCHFCHDFIHGNASAWRIENAKAGPLSLNIKGDDGHGGGELWEEYLLSGHCHPHRLDAYRQKCEDQRLEELNAWLKKMEESYEAKFGGDRTKWPFWAGGPKEDRA